MNYQHLHYQFPAQPFQRWHVIEDKTAPRGLRFRHARQPGESPDPKVNFGVEELSARLEHAGVEYMRIALGNDRHSFDLASVLLTFGIHEEDTGDVWHVVIPWVRDDGFYAVCLRERMPFQDACHLFGFDIPSGKPSVPKRIKRDVARGRTSLFGELVGTRELNQFDHIHTVMLADGKTTFEVATYLPGNRWPDTWTSGAALASPRGGAILTGHPVKVGDLIQITGALPNGQIKGNCLIWDIDHDLVVWDVKPELQAWQGHIYLSVLNELHGSPANLDVQTASNLDLAKVRDHKLIQYLCQEYACDVFDLMRGPAGAAKSAAAKATGGTAGIPTIAFDLPAMESSLVGASTERLRTALQIIDAVSQGRMLFIATCNSMASLPPELRRRFTLGTFFFDLPTADEREMIWRIYLKKYGVSGEQPNDEGWTGAEIKECCRKAQRLGITLCQASQYIVPISRSAAEQIKALRQMASGKFISAAMPGVYRCGEETATAGRRVIRELSGPLTVMSPSKSEV